MFLTYPEYVDLGYSTISEAEFPRFERFAERYIKSNTNGKVRLGAGYDDDIKEATALIADNYKNDETSGISGNSPGIISHESNDGLSTTYAVPNAQEALKMSQQSKRNILNTYLFESGWLYTGGTCCSGKNYEFTFTPPENGGNENGGDDMASKHCDVYYLLGNFIGGFDDYGNVISFPGGPVRYDCPAGSQEITVEAGNLTYAHGQFIILDISTHDVFAGSWPTNKNHYVCGYMHNNGQRRIIEVFGMGTQVWEP